MTQESCHKPGNGGAHCIMDEDIDILKDVSRRLEDRADQSDKHLGAIMAEAAGAHRDAHETRRALERIEPAIQRLVLLVGEPVPPSGLYGLVIRGANEQIARQVPSIRQSRPDLEGPDEITSVSRSYLAELKAIEESRLSSKKVEVERWKVVLAGVASIVVPVATAIVAYYTAKGG